MKLLDLLNIALLLFCASLLLGCAGGHRYHPCMDKDRAACPQWALDTMRACDRHRPMIINTNGPPQQFHLQTNAEQKEN